VLVGRSGPAYRTKTWLSLRSDHAAARDAVYADLDLTRDFGAELTERFGLFEVHTQARTRAEYLLRPDLGRRLEDLSREAIQSACPAGAEIQVIAGDGLSATAVATNGPLLLTALADEAVRRGWRLGRPFVVRNCRVGILNDVGDLLHPEVGVLLIGERPGLATAEGLSAYLAYRPRAGQTDADRNLISNIHCRGVAIEEAAMRIMGLAAAFRAACRSGVTVKEERSHGIIA
jgi:ethanolamine ammonia-lyase small subunit